MLRALASAAIIIALLPGARVAQEEAGPCDLRMALEYPRLGGAVALGAPLGVEGWAVDRAAPSGSGILSVQVALDVPREQGGALLVAQHAAERPDLARSMGDERYLFSGYRIDLPTADLDTGPHTLYVEVLTRCGWHTETRDVLVFPPAETVA